MGSWQKEGVNVGGLFAKKKEEGLVREMVVEVQNGLGFSLGKSH